ncbi:hypothetical protein VPNG_09517 [Cytospora leucostoma]|uniref:Uncharacterized protein n=1 Tax=Cytospora leucostoma TaxID=1230097 RepID=A0A423VS54_9PEZI|nr:hypothetical protein VPNG_09517 [Cytospora leucostoma]
MSQFRQGKVELELLRTQVRTEIQGSKALQQLIDGFENRNEGDARGEGGLEDGEEVDEHIEEVRQYSEEEIDVKVKDRIDHVKLSSSA